MLISPFKLEVNTIWESDSSDFIKKMEFMLHRYIVLGLKKKRKIKKKEKPTKKPPTKTKQGHKNDTSLTRGWGTAQLSILFLQGLLLCILMLYKYLTSEKEKIQLDKDLLKTGIYNRILHSVIFQKLHRHQWLLIT